MRKAIPREGRYGDTDPTDRNAGDWRHSRAAAYQDPDSPCVAAAPPRRRSWECWEPSQKRGIHSTRAGYHERLEQSVGHRRARLRHTERAPLTPPLVLFGYEEMPMAESVSSATMVLTLPLLTGHPLAFVVPDRCDRNGHPN